VDEIKFATTLTEVLSPGRKGAAAAGIKNASKQGTPAQAKSATDNVVAAAVEYGAEVGPTTQLVIPISHVIGGTEVANNAKKNPTGGYYSVFDSIGEFHYPATHGNQLGNTAMVNDHTYWDSTDGLKATHAPPPDPGGGNALWWPIPGEWASYGFNVTATDTYTVMTRFSSSWGPDKPVVIHMTIDRVSGGPLTLKPDEAKIWSDKYYQAGYWWGHTMTNCTSPVGWTLAKGHHMLKVHIDSFPEKPKDHGNIWIHYFKILKGGTPHATGSSAR
jgi:hypothetical protein